MAHRSVVLLEQVNAGLRRRRHMLDIDEPAAGFEQRKYFLIDFVFSGVGLMVNGEARYDRVKRTMSLHLVYPSLIAIIDILKSELTYILLEAFTGLGKHRLREIREHTMCRR